MSLTSYRAAPPRANIKFRPLPSSPEAPFVPVPQSGTVAGCSTPRQHQRRISAPETRKPPLGEPAAALKNIANGFLETPVSKPGDDLLFHCLGSSTIGAVRFHGRVRDGIGWVTDAMATKLWDRRFEEF